MPDVIMLRAGASGLQTAQQDLSVTVIEARNRRGRRIYTRLDQPGYPEMGFNSKGEAYGRDVSLFGPGQVRWVDAMTKTAGRPYFCGEQTAIDARGIGGALKSAERVTLEVLSSQRD